MALLLMAERKGKERDWTAKEMRASERGYKKIEADTERERESLSERNVAKKKRVKGKRNVAQGCL